MVAFDLKPSSAVAALWAEHLFSTYPPSEASAPPEHWTALDSHPEFGQAPCPRLRTYGPDAAEICWLTENHILDICLGFRIPTNAYRKYYVNLSLIIHLFHLGFLLKYAGLQKVIFWAYVW